MGLLSRLFGWGGKKKSDTDNTQSEVEEFMSLIGIYNQAYIVSHVGITDLKMVPEFAMYKRMMRIPTIGGKLGLAEKAHVKKLMITDYKMTDSFFKEIDVSIRKNCKGIRNVQGYFLLFGNFTNDLVTHLYTESQWKFMGAMLVRVMLRSTVKASVQRMMTKTSWKDSQTTMVVQKLKASATTLGYSNEWMSDFVYQILIQSKKSQK